MVTANDALQADYEILDRLEMVETGLHTIANEVKDEACTEHLSMIKYALLICFHDIAHVHREH